jgi:acyl carrier protein
MTDTKNAVKKYFAGFYKKPLNNSDNLFAKSVLDSMGLVGLITHLENELHIAIEPEDITEENFATIDAIAGLIQNKQK